MANYKIPKANIQKVVNGVVKELPKYKKAVGEYIPVAIGKAKDIASPVGKYLTAHWKEVFAGGAGGALLADNFNQRMKRRQEHNRHLAQEKLQAKAIQKQDAEIRQLKEKANEFDTVVALNEQLCDVVREMKDGGSVNEEAEEDKSNIGTAD